MTDVQFTTQSPGTPVAMRQRVTGVSSGEEGAGFLPTGVGRSGRCGWGAIEVVASQTSTACSPNANWEGIVGFEGKLCWI